MAEDTNQGTNVERNSAGGLDEAQSRRRFLKAAVVTTAGVATAAGVVGVDLASYSTKAPHILSTVFNIHSTPSKPLCAYIGFEETGLSTGACITTYSHSGKPQRYLIFYGSELPAGSYSFTATEQLNTGPIDVISSSSTPWQIQPSQIHVDVVAAGTGTKCPANAGSLPGTPSSSFSVTFNPSTKCDVVIYIHLSYYQSNAAHAGDKSTFTCKLTGPVSITKSATFTCV